MATWTLNIARTVTRSRVNGPGERFVVWAQGCTLRCPGCWNPDTWNPSPRHVVSSEVLAEEVRRTPGIEGLTLTGGEPFQQAGAFARLAAAVRAAGLSVMAFTGYELDELESPEQRRLLATCDILVTGRYVHSQRVLGDSWRGSANQSIHFLSARYAADRPDPAVCEFHLHDDGTLVLTGFPPDELRRLHEPSSLEPPGYGRPSQNDAAAIDRAFWRRGAPCPAGVPGRRA